MATTTTSSSNPPTDSEEWTESQLHDSLRTLDDLHKRLIALRTVIPTVLHPLFADYPTPVEMYEAFATNAQQCSEKIAGFNKMYVSSQEIFKYAAKRREAVEKEGRKVERLKGWELFLPDEEDEDGEKDEEPRVEAEKMDVVEKEPKEYLENEFTAQGVLEWKAAHPDLKMELEGGAWKITLPPPVAIAVTVELDPPNVTSVRSAESPLMPPLAAHNAILCALNKRKMPGNLRFLLEMVAAYTTVFSEKCAKCGKLIGGEKVELPVVRRYVKAEKKWVAVHEACV